MKNKFGLLLGAGSLLLSAIFGEGCFLGNNYQTNPDKPASSSVSLEEKIKENSEFVFIMSDYLSIGQNVTYGLDSPLKEYISSPNTAFIFGYRNMVVFKSKDEAVTEPYFGACSHTPNSMMVSKPHTTRPVVEGQEIELGQEYGGLVIRIDELTEKDGEPSGVRYTIGKRVSSSNK